MLISSSASGAMVSAPLAWRCLSFSKASEALLISSRRNTCDACMAVVSISGLLQIEEYESYFGLSKAKYWANDPLILRITNLLISVKRVGDDVKELSRLGLECVGFGRHLPTKSGHVWLARARPRCSVRNLPKGSRGWNNAPSVTEAAPETSTERPKTRIHHCDRHVSIQFFTCEDERAT